MSGPMRQRQQALDRVNEEIAREKAASLGRAGERLEDALAEVAALAARVGAAADAAERARLVAQHEAARVRAAQRRLALIIQREAMGLRSHRVLDQQFPEPRRLAGEAGA